MVCLREEGVTEAEGFLAANTRIQDGLSLWWSDKYRAKDKQLFFHGIYKG